MSAYPSPICLLLPSFPKYVVALGESVVTASVSFLLQSVCLSHASLSSCAFLWPTVRFLSIVAPRHCSRKSAFPSSFARSRLQSPFLLTFFLQRQSFLAGPCPIHLFTSKCFDYCSECGSLSPSSAGSAASAFSTASVSFVVIVRRQSPVALPGPCQTMSII